MLGTNASAIMNLHAVFISMVHAPDLHTHANKRNYEKVAKCLCMNWSANNQLQFILIISWNR